MFESYKNKSQRLYFLQKYYNFHEINWSFLVLLSDCRF